ncbi:RCC1-like domain-containing protein [Duganella vulcania]|uniref:RCC1-like domain-containing protein n=1 Tax=Duganella vulcania TaxID=2692166 RepID=UPI0035A58981
MPIPDIPYDHDIALTRDGYVCAWGDNSYGAARPDSAQRIVPAPAPVMLDDGRTPLKLMGNWNADGKEESIICGGEQ